MISYTDSLKNVTAARLTGFFVGWPNPPSPETHLRILRKSYRVVLAVETETNRVVGYVNAISDGVLAAYLPLLEVLPEFRGRGIGTDLIRRMLAGLNDLYMVDLVCDPDLQSFYRRLGMAPATGMMVRKYERQSGN